MNYYVYLLWLWSQLINWLSNYLINLSIYSKPPSWHSAWASWWSLQASWPHRQGLCLGSWQIAGGVAGACGGGGGACGGACGGAGGGAGGGACGGAGAGACAGGGACGGSGGWWSSARLGFALAWSRSTWWPSSRNSSLRLWICLIIDLSI